MRIGMIFLLAILAFSRELWLLQEFDAKMIENHPSAYVYSEKLDGVRAYWDGKYLYSKGGKRFSPPLFFTQNFPPFAIEGELWSKRGDFENIVSIVSSNTQRWEELKLYVFEVPNQKGGILERLEVLQDYLALHHAPYIKIIPQHSFSSLENLIEQMESLTLQGAEGIVVREREASYYTGRSKKAMKLKPYFDAECQIIGYIQGKGKYKDQVGSILCEDGERTIKIGSGMSEKLRENPPKIGTWITYKYFGKTKRGMPKFPVFLRIREDHFLNKGAE